LGLQQGPEQNVRVGQDTDISGLQACR
jgi:hypothetical protein